MTDQEKAMTSGKRYQVFSIKEGREKDGRGNGVWVRAGSAWVNRDGSMNVYLDVLPLDGKLHVREAADKRDSPEVQPLVAVQGAATNESRSLGMGVQ
jgi:hypothetical protein